MANHNIDTIIHYVNLDTLGGVENLFKDYLRACDDEAIAQSLILGTHGIHDYLRPNIETRVKGLCREKYYHWLKLPRYPSCLRRANVKRFLSSQPKGICVFWNKIEPEIAAIAKKLNQAVVYFEHGTAWNSKGQKMERMLRQVDKIVCNSNASSAFVRHRWDTLDLPIQAIPLPLGHRFESAHALPKAFPQGRPIRLGTAGRLVNVKGLILALYVLKILRSRGMDCQLYLAGDGPGKKQLQRLSNDLGVSKHVYFKGMVKNMLAFYFFIDLLMAPSLRETFGLACLEASSLGCPPVASYVDGLCETVSDGQSGILVSPTLTIDEYVRLGGGRENIPEKAYFPMVDRIGPPMALDPVAIAEVIENLLNDPIRYETMSAEGIHWTRSNFSSHNYFRSLLASFLSLS